MREYEKARPRKTSLAKRNVQGERRTLAELYGGINENSVYKRSYGQRRPPLIPPNYSGNAFSVSESQEDISDAPSERHAESDVLDTQNEHGTSYFENAHGSEVKSDQATDASLPKSAFRTPQALFKSTLGNEELLLLAIIFLLFQSGESDVLPYLVMLLLA